ncbi:MAG: universal stress protein [Coxiellaceae bacterium]|nr:universal stress protein [Coxiellaceae bacterium]
MKDYKHILLATDLSGQSDIVAKRAREIADESKAKLSVVYVMEHSPVAYGGEYSIPIDANLEESLEKKAESSLAKLGNKFNIASDNQHVSSGSVKLGVIDTAEEIKADLIVVGTHSHHGLEAILGSRASAILNHAKCDVLVVRVG